MWKKRDVPSLQGAIFSFPHGSLHCPLKSSASPSSQKTSSPVGPPTHRTQCLPQIQALQMHCPMGDLPLLHSNGCCSDYQVMRHNFRLCFVRRLLLWVQVSALLKKELQFRITHSFGQRFVRSGDVYTTIALGSENLAAKEKPTKTEHSTAQHGKS